MLTFASKTGDFQTYNGLYIAGQIGLVPSYTPSSSPVNLTLTTSTVVNDWINPAGGDWDTASNWTYGVPVAGQSVAIPYSGITVTHSQSTAEPMIASLDDLATLNITSGSIAIGDGSSTFDGPVTIGAAATLSVGAGASVLVESALSDAGAVTFTSGAQVTVYDAAIYVSGSLTLNGVINLGNASGSVYGDLYFENGPHTLSGTGTVTLGTSISNYLEAYGPNTAATLTIGSGITVEGGSGTVGGYYSADSLVNDGTITSASGQTLTIQGSNWVNNGTITTNGATVNLGGSFTTAALGNFNASGSTVNLVGTLNNAGATLALSPAIGAWRLLGGTIAGGTITSTGGSTLALDRQRWHAGRRRHGRFGNHAGRDTEHRRPRSMPTSPAA